MHRGLMLGFVIGLAWGSPLAAWGQDGAAPAVVPLAPPPALAPAALAPAALAPADAAAFQALGEAKGRAEAKATQKTAEAKEAAAEEKEERASKLLQNGVTIGQAATVLVPLASGGGGDFDLGPQGDLVAMPYIALFPAYWRGGPSQRTYCASVFSNTESDARTAADEIARKQAEIFAAQFEEAYAADGSGAMGLALASATNTDVADLAGAHAGLLAAAQAWANAPPASKEAAHADLVRATSAEVVGWRMNVDANCVAHKFGFYVGLPTDANLTFRSHGRAAGETEVDNVISAGLAFVPNAWFAVLVGYVYSHADLELDGATASLNVHSLAFSIGGNLDALGALTK